MEVSCSTCKFNDQKNWHGICAPCNNLSEWEPVKA